MKADLLVDNANPNAGPALIFGDELMDGDFEGDDDNVGAKDDHIATPLSHCFQSLKLGDGSIPKTTLPTGSLKESGTADPIVVDGETKLVWSEGELACANTQILGVEEPCAPIPVLMGTQGQRFIPRGLLEHSTIPKDGLYSFVFVCWFFSSNHFLVFVEGSAALGATPDPGSPSSFWARDSSDKKRVSFLFLPHSLRRFLFIPCLFIVPLLLTPFS